MGTKFDRGSKVPTKIAEGSAGGPCLFVTQGQLMNYTENCTLSDACTSVAFCS